MCEKCLRKGKKARLSKGKIRYFAVQALRGYPIPLFRDNPSNYAIEGEIYTLLRKKTKRNKYMEGRIWCAYRS
jgi:hypothetical protein